MYYIDVKYLKLISPKLKGFTQKSNDLWNCRCFYCGDSQKKRSKKRGYFYKKNNSLNYKCFNCSASTTFYKVLEYVDPSLAHEYSLERFMNKGSAGGNYVHPEIIHEIPNFHKKYDINIPAISSLPNDNAGRIYLQNRKIPKGCLHDIYYTDNFKKFVLSIKPSYDKILFEDERIVLPFRDEEGNLKGFQGRSIGNSDVRYITVKLDEDFPKIFGLNRVNRREKVNCVEGPFDSLFLKNGVATADAALDFAVKFFDKEQLVLIPDREPRNEQICKGIKKYIENGFSVCLFPDYLKGKDINEFIMNGLSKPELYRIIDANTFSGLEAELEFNRWRNG